MKWAQFWARMRPRKIIIYADFIDPFCYIGYHNARLAAAEAGIPLEWRGFEMNPGTPFEGSLLETAANSDLRMGMWASVADFAKQSGLDLAQPDRAPNTQLALGWVNSLRKRDVKNSLIERIYQAYLSDKKDIGDPTLLAGLANDIGLEDAPIWRLEKNRAASRLEEFRAEAIRHGFPGMPGFLYKGKTYFGALSVMAWTAIFEETAACSIR